jgi:hypothetical protein
MARDGRGCLTRVRVALPPFCALIGSLWVDSPHQSFVHANHCDSGWKGGVRGRRFESSLGTAKGKYPRRQAPSIVRVGTAVFALASPE